MTRVCNCGIGLDRYALKDARGIFSSTTSV